MKVYVLVNSGSLVGAYESAADMMEAAAEEIESTSMCLKAENIDYDEYSGSFSVSMEIEDITFKVVEFDR